MGAQQIKYSVRCPQFILAQIAPGFFQNLTDPRIVQQQKPVAQPKPISGPAPIPPKPVVVEQERNKDYGKAMDLLKKEEQMINQFKGEIATAEKTLHDKMQQKM